MAFRSLTRGLFQLVNKPRLYSTIQKQIIVRKPILYNQKFLPFRTFSAVQTNEDAYKDLNRFLEKEIQLEKSAQQYPSQLPKIQNFEVIISHFSLKNLLFLRFKTKVRKSL
jgi:hypothetical protein